MDKQYELFFGRLIRYEFVPVNKIKKVCKIYVDVLDRETKEVTTKRVVISNKQASYVSRFKIGRELFVRGQRRIISVINKVGIPQDVEEITAWDIGIARTY